MKKVFLLFIVISICSANQLFAQSSQFTSDAYLLDSHIKRHDKTMKYTEEENYKGTPFSNPSYQIGNVYKGNALFATNVALRYNVMADEIEVKESLLTNDEDARVLTKSPEMFAKIKDDIFVFVPFQGKVDEGGYFQVMFEGKKVDLYKKWEKEFTPVKKAGTSITRELPATFKDKPKYFLVTKSGKFFELPAARSKKLNVFGAKKKALQKFIQENTLDINKEDDLKRLIVHYDTM